MHRELLPRTITHLSGERVRYSFIQCTRDDHGKQLHARVYANNERIGFVRQVRELNAEKMETSRWELQLDSGSRLYAADLTECLEILPAYQAYDRDNRDPRFQVRRGTTRQEVA